MTAADPLAGLRLLVGAWRGEGTVRGRPATSRSRCEETDPGTLRLDVETSRGGAVFHAERVVWHAAPDGRLSCTTIPAASPGAAQEWLVETLPGGGGWRLARPGFEWTIRRAGPDAWSETFDAVAPGGTSGRIVALRHVRDEDPAR